MRLGWFRPVHCKSMAAQEVRALLTARKLVQSKLYDIEMSLRGILRGFGLKVGPTTSRSFAARINHLAAGHPSLEMVAEALLSTHAAALCAFKNLEKTVRQISRADARVRLLMSTPGVGLLVALTYVSAIDDPKRFTSSKRVGAHFGLTPKKYQSGETDISGRISKTGDSSVRAALYEAAHIILTRPIHGGALKSWAMRLAKRAGMKKAKVALARKLAVLLHRMWLAPVLSISKKPTVACAQLNKRSSQVSAEGHDTRPSRSEVPSPGRWTRSHRDRFSGIATTLTRLAGLIHIFEPHQVAATCRPRTEARVRRLGGARGIDKSRPVTEEPISKLRMGVDPL